VKLVFPIRQVNFLMRLDLNRLWRSLLSYIPQQMSRRPSYRRLLRCGNHCSTPILYVRKKHDHTVTVFKCSY